MVLMLEMQRQQEEAENGGQGGMGGGYNGVKNSHPGAGQKMQGETVQYVNENA